MNHVCCNETLGQCGTNTSAGQVGRCVNTNFDYYCDCNTGYTENDAKMCVGKCSSALSYQTIKWEYIPEYVCELTAEVLLYNWDHINFLNKYNVHYIIEFYQVKIQLAYIPNLCKESKRNEWVHII